MYNAEKLRWLNDNFPAFTSYGNDILSCLDYNIEYDADKDALKISSKCVSDKNGMPLAEGIVERDNYCLKSTITTINGNEVECQSLAQIWTAIAKTNEKIYLEDERCGDIDWIGIYEKFKEKGAFKDYAGDFLHWDRLAVMRDKPNAVIAIRKENGSWLIHCGDTTKEEQLSQLKKDIVGLLKIREGQLENVLEGSPEKLIKEADNFLNEHPKIAFPSAFWIAGSAIGIKQYNNDRQFASVYITDVDNLTKDDLDKLPEQPEYAKADNNFVIPLEKSSLTMNL